MHQAQPSADDLQTLASDGTKSAAKIGYERYRQVCGTYLPEWPNVVSTVRLGWEAAAQAILAELLKLWQDALTTAADPALIPPTILDPTNTFGPLATVGKMRTLDEYENELRKRTNDATAAQERAVLELDEQRLAAATEVGPEYTGPVFLERAPVFINAPWEPRFFDSVADLIETFHEDHPDADPTEFEDGDPLPEFAFAVTETVVEFSFEHEFERMNERIAETGRERLYPGVLLSGALKKAIRDFNEINRNDLTCWTADYTQKVRIRPSRRSDAVPQSAANQAEDGPPAQ